MEDFGEGVIKEREFIGQDRDPYARLRTMKDLDLGNWKHLLSPS